MKIVEVLLLDFYETLVEYQNAETKALTKLFEKYKLTKISFAIRDYKKINNEIWLELENGYKTIQELRFERFERFQKLYPLNKDSLELDLEYRDYFIDCTFLFDNVKSSLNKIKEMGIKLVIVSNGFTDTQTMRIKKVGIKHLIEGLFTSEEVGRAKPDPLMLKKALALVNRQKDKCWLVGDSLRSDIAAANIFNIHSCLIGNAKINTNENPCPSMTVSNFPEFTQLLMKTRL